MLVAFWRTNHMMHLNIPEKHKRYVSAAMVLFLPFAAVPNAEDIEFTTVASWYGPGFHGRKTASGAIFDQNKMTAASKTLPFGTKLAVTNLHNGRSCQVVINDRGPYVAGRGIDLSREAARRIGMDGIARVKCIGVSKSRRPGAPLTAPIEETGSPQQERDDAWQDAPQLVAYHAPARLHASLASIRSGRSNAGRSLQMRGRSAFRSYRSTQYIAYGYEAYEGAHRITDRQRMQSNSRYVRTYRG